MKTMQMRNGGTNPRLARWGKVSLGVAAVVCAVAVASPAMADTGDGYSYDFGSGNIYSWGGGSDGGYGYGSGYGDGWSQPGGSSNWWASNNVVQNILQGQSWSGAPSVANSGVTSPQSSIFGNSLLSSWWR